MKKSSSFSSSSFTIIISQNQNHVEILVTSYENIFIDSLFLSITIIRNIKGFSNLFKDQNPVTIKIQWINLKEILQNPRLLQNNFRGFIFIIFYFIFPDLSRPKKICDFKSSKIFFI